MSYGSAMALQEAVYGALTADATVMSLSGGAIYDAIPPGNVPDLHVTLGAERVRRRADKTGPGALHEFSIVVMSDAAGFATAKALSVAVSDALDGADLSLSRGHLVRLDFWRAQARRTATARQIELWFRARIDLSAS